jgi:hypothetical protein
MAARRKVSEEAARRGPGRPPIYDEKWTKVTVVLFDRQIAFLDALSASIRARNGTSMSRAQVIRAFVDAVNEAEIDLTACSSAADLKAAMRSRLSNRP